MLWTEFISLKHLAQWPKLKKHYQTFFFIYGKYKFINNYELTFGTR